MEPQAVLLLALEEISYLVSRDGDPSETLDSILRLVQSRFAVDVCSAYLLEADRGHLTLSATVGLRPESVGHVRMSLHEGLCGLVAEQMQPVIVPDAPTHPRFKLFKNTGEDDYHSFLGIPVIDRGLLQGVLVVQTREPRAFTADEARVLLTVGSQLGQFFQELRTRSQFVAPAFDRLWALARNLWWSWDGDAASLFRDLDPDRWIELDHNPIAFLSELPIEQVEQRAAQLGLHSRINNTYRRFQEYLRSDSTWSSTHAGVLRARPVAYFSAEFGLHESLPIYSGGLGILAGDHVKSASDLGVPLIAVGLFYDQGYFRQRLDHDCLQKEEYLDVNPRLLPIKPATNTAGVPIQVSIETRTGTIAARVWEVAVGRVTLYLLDSDVDGNAPEDRDLTARLYGGDTRVRIRQELILGVGGLRALTAMGITPGVLHLNEGHSSFAVLEMIRLRMQMEGLSFDESARRVALQTCFTTHTPVPAGHDRFTHELIEEHLGPLRDELNLSYDQLQGLGRVDTSNHSELFTMTVLALKLSRRANAVSSLHGEVSRSMWVGLYPGRHEDAVPIGHITNGVHVKTWLAPQMHAVYDRHLSPDWWRHSGEAHVWEAIDRIDDGEIWETHQALKARLLGFVRRRGTKLAELRGEPKAVLDQARRALSLDALTIGIARRFATYKRSNLILQDLDQIEALINNAKMPIQLVFAGKAHPMDKPGKEVLQTIARLTHDPAFAGKVVFIEDYEINTARHLVAGVDVWMNNPRRPLEASGTSGMKVVLNGVLNLSILDGWWAEAYDGGNGFAIGNGETHSNTEVHDRRDRDSLYKTLKDEVVPLFYQRNEDGLPTAWIARMKRAIKTLGWRFSAHRMVMDYVQKSYLPAAGGTSSDMTRC